MHSIETTFDNLLKNLSSGSWEGNGGIRLGEPAHDLVGHLYLAAGGPNTAPSPNERLVDPMRRYNNAYHFNLPSQRSVAHYLTSAIRPFKRHKRPLNYMQSVAVMLGVLNNFSQTTSDYKTVEGVVRGARDLHQSLITKREHAA